MALHELRSLACQFLRFDILTTIPLPGQSCTFHKVMSDECMGTYFVSSPSPSGDLTWLLCLISAFRLEPPLRACIYLVCKLLVDCGLQLQVLLLVLRSEVGQKGIVASVFF
jgi:hypothetical protein